MIFFDSNEASKRAKDGTLITKEVMDFLKVNGDTPVRVVSLQSSDVMWFGYSDITEGVHSDGRVGVEGVSL